MYLSAYHFDGDPTELLEGFERLLINYEDAIDLQLCVVNGLGITVYDGCPTAEIAEDFQRSPAFASAIAAAGLPAPRIEAVGEIHKVRVRDSAFR